MPDWIWAREGTWHGGDVGCLFLCPSIGDSAYYGAVYRGIKADFGDLPHVIFGRQNVPCGDPAALPYLTAEELLALYARMRVFVYPSSEPRHVHYSPVEAMIVGAPVLFMRGSMLDLLAAKPLAGLCADRAEMRAKACRILAGDDALVRDIQDGQRTIAARFTSDVARAQWRRLLARVDAWSVPCGGAAGSGTS